MARTPDTNRRNEIARAAFEVIRARGIDKTTMSELAQALGMKRPTLYWYFKDLGAIVDAILADTRERLRGFVTERVAAERHPLDVMETLLRSYLEFFATRRDDVHALIQLWARAESSHPDQFRADARAFVEPVRAQLIALLDAGIARGDVAAHDPSALIDLLVFVADGALIHREIRDIDPEPAIDVFVAGALAPLRRAGGDP